MKTIFKAFCLIAIVGLVLGFSPIKPVSADTSSIVNPVSTDWAFVNDNGSIGDWNTSFVTGPGTPPAGIGSAKIQLNSAAAGIILAAAKYQGVTLSAITSLSYSTYTNLAPAAMSFQINYDPDVTTVESSTWYGRLVYEPYMNGTVVNGTWQTWDMINGGNAKWWAVNNANSTVDEACPQSAPCTLTALLAAFPNIGIRNDSWAAIQFKAGSNWNGFIGNIDNLTFATAGSTDTYNFEPLTVVYVDDSWSAVTPGTDPDGAGPAQKFGVDSFATIQEGIAAVAAGGTVYVAAGTYTETGQIVISKNLTIIGEDKTTTIINPAGSTGADGDARGWFLVNSGVLFNLSNVTLDGTGQAIHTAIRTHGTGTIDNIIITNIRYAAYYGIGVYAYAGTTVSNSTLTNIERIGLYANTEAGAVGHPIFTGNTYIGKGAGTWLDYGIEVENGATATITNNTISDCVGVAADTSTSAGIYATTFFAPGTNATITGNTLTNNYAGIQVGYTPTDSTTVVATNNIFSGNTYAISTTSTGTTVTASGNWYGSISGPAAGQIDGLVTYNPWCGDSGCTFLVYGVLPGYTIQSAIDAAPSGGTVYVPAGTYDEDVIISKPLTLLGAGAGTTTIRGVIGGDSATVRIGASNVTVDGFTITRLGNNTTDWNNPALNLAGIAIQGQANTGTIIQNNIITGNRSGIDINDSSGHTIQDNTITNNRTGIIFGNRTNNMTVINNEITNNWTMGILFLDRSNPLGSNVPEQSAHTSTFSFNNINGNWYGQVVDRQSGGSIPTPGTTNLKNFAQNWWGTTTPVVSTANSTEPGYSALIPVAFGGTSTPPTGQADILGTASANIVYWPLCSDLACSTSFYPPVHNITKDTYYFTIQAAIAAASDGDTFNLAATTYTEVGQIVINKNLTIVGADQATTIIKPAQNTVGVADAGSWFLVNQGVNFNLSYVTLDGIGKDIRQGIRTNGNTVVDHVTIQNMVYPGYSGFGIAQGYTNTVPQSLTVTNSTITGFGRVGIQLDEGSAASTGTISNNTITCTGPGDKINYGITVEGGATATITGNTITNCYGIVSPWESAAIELSTYFAPGTTATITGNFLFNNLNGILIGYDGADTSVVTAENNKIYNITESLIESSGTAAVVDASPNWWGTANIGSIEPKIVGTLTFKPYWIDEAMSILSGTSVSPVYVDDDYAAMTDCGIHTCGYDAFATIQEGISAVTTGGTIYVAAGTYTQDLSINKAVTLLGPNASINPNTGTRVAEAVIHPSTSYPDPSVCTNTVYLTTSNITFKGFTVDGDNPAIDSGVMIGTADVNACELLAGYEGMGNIVVENNILKNATYTGIDFYNYTNSAATAGNYIRYNLIQNIGTVTYSYGIGTLIYNNFYADITNNVYDNVRLGVQTGNYWLANPGTTGSISNNVINPWMLGIFHNTQYGSATPFTLANNTITAINNPGNTSKWNGILLSVHQNAASSIVTNNTITIPDTLTYSLYSAGYNVWSTAGTTPFTISGGTVTGGSYGIFVNNWEGYAAGPDTSLVTRINVDGITILNSAIAGVYVKDNPSNTHPAATVYANIQNSTIDTNGTGILVEGTDATAVANHNDLTGNPTAGITNLNTTFTMDGRFNWWGSFSGPGPVGPGTGVNVSTFVDYGSWDSVHNLTQDTWYPSIHAAIDAANTGDQIYLGAATYKENVVVNKSVTIFGAGQGSTIVMPAISAANPCTGSSLCGGTASNVFLVQANNVIIHDLTVDGDNPGLTSSIVRGGADVDARNGIIVNSAAGSFTNLEVYNVTVQNIYLRGIQASSVGGTFNFHNNTVTNVQGDGYSIGIFAWYGPGTIANNTVSYANDAISANHSRGIQFLNNTVTHSGSGVHSDNSNDGGGVPDVISGNNVSSCMEHGYGIWTFVNYNTITVSNNTVSGCEIAYSIWGGAFAPSTTQMVSFNNNTAIAPSPNTNSVGIYVTTNTVAYGYTDVLAEFNGNSISGFATGLEVSANQVSWDTSPYVAKTITSTFLNNQITGSTEMAAYQGTSGTYNTNYQGNWWGARLGPDALKMSAGITYSRWCGDAGCTFLYPVALGEPVGTKTSWDQYFRWQGVPGAYWYILELYNSSDALVTSKWVSPSTACVGTACSYIITPTMPLANGTYHWRIRDTYSGGYGTWSDFNYFTLNIPACYILNTVTDPVGAGTITRNTATNCTVGGQNGYLDGTSVTLTANPTAGYGFQSWMGGVTSTSNPVTFTITTNTTVTAKFFSGPVTGSPRGTMTTWDKSFNWTPIPGSYWYILELYNNTSNTLITSKWVSASTYCTTTACKYVITPAIELANGGSYRWRIRNTTNAGYGIWSADTNFTLNLSTIGGSIVLNAPIGNIYNSTWDKYFRWTGENGSYWYILELYNGSNTLITSKWISASTYCSGTTCAYVIPMTYPMPTGIYSWRIRNTTSAGYGIWTPLSTFTVFP